MTASGPGPPGGFTFDHEEFSQGEHWFSARDDQERQAGFGYAIEMPGSSASARHVLIKKLYVRPGDRGKGIGSRLIEEIAGHFCGYELRLKPFPDEDGALDAEELREFYAGRGFGDYIPLEGDTAWDRWEYMTMRAPAVLACQRAAGDAACEQPGMPGSSLTEPTRSQPAGNRPRRPGRAVVRRPRRPRS